MSTAYVGMSTVEGTCEGVEVAAPEAKPSQSKQERPVDEFVLVGSTSGTTGQNPFRCLTDLSVAVTQTSMSVYQVLTIKDATRDFIKYRENPAKLAKTEGLHTLKFVGYELLKRLFKETIRLVIDRYEQKKLAALWKMAWNSCGRPGDGLREWLNQPIRLPQRQPAPVAKRVPTPETSPFRFSLPEFDLNLPKISPEATRNAAMATGTILLIGAMILLAPVGI